MSGPTNPAEMFFNRGAWGWSGTEWVRAGVFLNYHDRYVEDLGQAGVPGGLYNATSTAVPAGYVYVISNISINNQTGARGMTAIHFRANGLYGTVGFKAAPVQYEPTIWDGAVALKEGDYVQVQQLGTVAGDTIIACVLGYKVRVAE